MHTKSLHVTNLEDVPTITRALRASLEAGIITVEEARECLQDLERFINNHREYAGDGVLNAALKRKYNVH